MFQYNLSFQEQHEVEVLSKICAVLLSPESMSFGNVKLDMAQPKYLVGVGILLLGNGKCIRIPLVFKFQKEKNI